jgi:hypothetical protein
MIAAELPGDSGVRRSRSQAVSAAYAREVPRSYTRLMPPTFLARRAARTVGIDGYVWSYRTSSTMRCLDPEKTWSRDLSKAVADHHP